MAALVKVDEDLEGEATEQSLAETLQEVVGEGQAEQALVPPRPILDKKIDASIFSKDALGNGIKWATAAPAMQIGMQINFVVTGTFTRTLFGKSVK